MTNCDCGAALALPDGGPDDAGPIGALLDGLPDNWGRWGPDDERGTLNLLGSAEMAAGLRAALANGDGAIERYTLGLPITGEPIPPEDRPTTATGDPAFPGRGPVRRENVCDAAAYRDGEFEPQAGMKFVDDRFVTPLYPHGISHMDALGHAWYGETLYNGFDAATTAERKRFEQPVETLDGAVVETRGLGALSISPAAECGVAGRAVLLDVGRAIGDRDRLSPEYEIGLDELQRTATEQGLSVQKCDVLLVRTGSLSRTRDPDAEWSPTDEPGLVFSEALVEWVHELDVAAIGADNVAVERVVQWIDGERYVLPLHGAFLRNLGLPLVEMLWLEELADACDAAGEYVCLLTAAPLHVERASGGPINPVVLAPTG